MFKDKMETVKNILKGLTLIEWMIIVAIVAIIAALIVRPFSGLGEGLSTSIPAVELKVKREAQVICHEGWRYIVHEERLVSLDEQC